MPITRSKSVPRMRSLSDGLSELLGISTRGKPEKPRYSFAYCTERNKPYYYDRKTRKTTWKKPPNFDKEWQAYQMALEEYDDGGCSVYSCAPPAPPPFSSSKSNPHRQQRQQPRQYQNVRGHNQRGAGHSLASFAACSAASSWREYLGGDDDFLKQPENKHLLNDAGFQAIEKPTWRSAVDEGTGKTYYYHRMTRETTWYKPPTYDQERQEYKRRRDEYVKKSRKDYSGLSPRSKALGAGSSSGFAAASKIIRSLSPKNMRKPESRSPEQAKSRETPSPLRELAPDDYDPTYGNRPRHKFASMFKRNSRKPSNNSHAHTKSPAVPARKSREPVHIYHEQDYYNDLDEPIPLCTSPTYGTGATGTTTQYSKRSERSSECTTRVSEETRKRHEEPEEELTPAQLDYIEWVRSPSRNTGGIQTPASRGPFGDRYSRGGFEETIVSPVNIDPNTDRYVVFEFPVEENWEMKTMVSDISMFEPTNQMFSMDAICKSPCAPTSNKPHKIAEARGRMREKMRTRSKRSKSTGRSGFRF